MLITSQPIFDDVTLCKHVTSEENAFIVFNSFSYTKNTHVILAIIIVTYITQIVILIMSSLSGTGFYAMRWVKYGGWCYEKISR